MYDVLLQISLTVPEKDFPQPVPPHMKRTSFRTRLACGKQMQHIELDTKGKPTNIGTQLLSTSFVIFLQPTYNFNLIKNMHLRT